MIEAPFYQKPFRKKKPEIQHSYPVEASSHHILENAEDKRDIDLAQMACLCETILTATESHQEES